MGQRAGSPAVQSCEKVPAPQSGSLRMAVSDPASPAEWRTGSIVSNSDPRRGRAGVVVAALR